MWRNGSILAWNGRDVGLIPALGTIFPIFIAPTTCPLLPPIAYVYFFVLGIVEQTTHACACIPLGLPSVEEVLCRINKLPWQKCPSHKINNQQICRISRTLNNHFIHTHCYLPCLRADLIIMISSSLRYLCSTKMNANFLLSNRALWKPVCYHLVPPGGFQMTASVSA